MSGLLGWLFVIGGPAACALAGAWYEHIRTARNISERLDLAYERGWDEAQDRYRAWYGSMQLEAEQAPEPAATLLLSPAVPASGQRPALPPVYGEGPRHARPQEPAQDGAYDPLIEGVKAQFDMIRASLGLAPYYLPPAVVGP